MMQDWQLVPAAHEFELDPQRGASGCFLCGCAKHEHTGARIPVDQILRRLPERLAPRLIP
jgi:hypothetical protein